MHSVTPFHLLPLRLPTDGFAELLDDSRRGGFRMLVRLGEEWESGVNRFDRWGETFLGAFDGKRLVGVGGRNIDPFEDDPAVGRIRHLYVAEDMRRLGIGHLLVRHMLSDAALYFRRLNLRAPEAAFGFYEHLGFARSDGPDTVTHHFTL